MTEQSDRDRDPVDRHVGRRTRLRRQALALSQRTLARRIGVTSQAVQKYESGGARLSAGRLFAMARALGVPPGYFFEGLNHSSGATPRALRGAAETEALVHAYQAIRSPRLQAEVLRLITLLGALGADAPD